MKESDIRPDELAALIEQYAREDKQYLTERQRDFVTVPCPACGAAEGSYRFDKFEIRYEECRSCRTVFASPRPTAEILKEYYRRSKNYRFWNSHVFPASEEARRKNIFGPRVEMLEEYCVRFEVRRGVMLEVGAGFGTFCQEVIRRRLFDRVIAVELTPDLAERCRRRGIEVIESPIEEVAPEVVKADVLASFETIEHLFNPYQFLTACRQRINPGGVLVLSCPNMLGFDTMTLGPLSKSVGGEHLNLFNPRSMARLLSRAGFEVLSLDTPGKLDAELVRKAIFDGRYTVKDQPFLAYVLLDEWETLGDPFQAFLSAHGLSSHMVAVARNIEVK